MRALIASFALAAAGLTGCAMTDEYESAPPGEVYFLAPTATPSAVSARVSEPLVGTTLYDGYGQPAGQIVGVGRNPAGQIGALAVRVADGSIRQVLPQDIGERNGVLSSGFSAEQIEALPSTTDRF